MEYISSVMVDRTRTILDCGYPNIQILNEIPSSPINPGDFSAVVDRTASALVNRSITENLPIAILYSGGMDSTCVVSAFLKAGALITIVGSQASIDENLIFYNEVLKDNPLVTIKIDNPLLRLRNESLNYIWVTGECGAHLMGTINWTKYGGREMENIDAIEADHLASSIFKNPEPYFNLPVDVKTYLLKVMDKAPVSFRSNYDAQWWAIFALKYQFVQFRTQLWVGKICPTLVNFFMNDEFQHWAITHDSAEKCPDFEWRNYKMPIRDYIFHFCHLREASYELPKRASFERTYNKLKLMDSFVLAKPLEVGWVTATAKVEVERNLHITKSGVT